jgi:hypothetical protein
MGYTIYKCDVYKRNGSVLVDWEINAPLISIRPRERNGKTKPTLLINCKVIILFS